jgi:hypothetical protein
MSDDDFISALTQEVKEDVIRNYLYERRLIEEQVNYVNELLEHARLLQERLYQRFARIYDLLREPEFVSQFAALLGLEKVPFGDRAAGDTSYRKNLRFIKVRGITDRVRFKKLLAESYQRLISWNNQYLKAYKALQKECEAVNDNLGKFENNFDLLGIIRFLKEIDVEGIERKHFLGENFTPEEMGSIEKSLSFKSLHMNTFQLLEPLKLPPLKAVEKSLNALADCIYGQFRNDIKRLIG